MTSTKNTDITIQERGKNISGHKASVQEAVDLAMQTVDGRLDEFANSSVSTGVKVRVVQMLAAMMEQLAEVKSTEDLEVFELGLQLAVRLKGGNTVLQDVLTGCTKLRPAQLSNIRDTVHGMLDGSVVATSDGLPRPSYVHVLEASPAPAPSSPAPAAPQATPVGGNQPPSTPAAPQATPVGGNQPPSTPAAPATQGVVGPNLANATTTPQPLTTPAAPANTGTQQGGRGQQSRTTTPAQPPETGRIAKVVNAVRGGTSNKNTPRGRG